MRMNRPLPAAIGFRVHSGWAAAVVVAGSPRTPAVLCRSRIEIADRTIPGSVQPYHAAKTLGLKQAESLLKRCTDSSRSLALAALQKLIDDLGAAHKVIGCGLLLGSGRQMKSLETTLASNDAIHTEDGD